MPDGLVDIVDHFAIHDTCLILPTLDHALFWWPRFVQCVKDRQGEEWVNQIKTGIVSKATHTVLRLWVPYSLDPTMPMDFIHEHVFHTHYMSNWYTEREVKRIVRGRDNHS